MTIYDKLRRVSVGCIMLMVVALAGCSVSVDTSSFQSNPGDPQTDIQAREGLPERPEENDFLQPVSQVRAQASTVQFGDTILVSSNSAGQAANGYSYQSTLSENGTYAVFTSRATNLDGNPSGTYYQVYRKNLETGAVELVSRHNGQNGSPGYYPCYRAKVNKAGDQVAFTSYENLTGNGIGYQVYLRDLNTHTNKLISHSPTGGAGNSTSMINSFQGGGAISFYSYANNLVGTDTNGRYDIFAWHPSSDSLEMISVASDESQAVDHSLESSVSMSGGVGVFRCYDNALEGSGHPDPTLYLRDLDAGLTLPLPGQAGPAYFVTASTGGYYTIHTARVLLNGSYKNALYHQFGTSNPVLVHDNVYLYESAATEAHGKYVVYVSADQGGADNDGQYDIYVWDRINNRHRMVSGNSPGTSGCFRPHISQDGSTISWDQNGQVYAAPNPYWGYQPPAQPEVISRNWWGDPANGDSQAPTLSYTGQHVAFRSAATNIISGPSYTDQVFHKDLAATSSANTWVSEPLGSYVDESKRPFLSQSGDHVLFASAYDLQNPSSPAQFAHFREVGNPAVTQVGGVAGTPWRNPWSVGGDRYCCFDTSESLVAQDTGGHDVYLEDQQTGQKTLVSVDSYGQRISGSNMGGWVSHDGQKVAWLNFSGSNNTLWVRDLSTGVSTIVTTQINQSFSELSNSQAAIDLSGDGQYLVYKKGNVIHRYRLSNATDTTFSSANPASSSIGVSDDGRFIAFIQSSDIKVLDTETSATHLVQSSYGFGFSTPRIAISGNGASVTWQSYTDEDNGANLQIWIGANPAF